VIQRLNEQFVCTTLSYPEVWKLSLEGNPIARQVVDRWSVPLVLLFLTPECQFVLKLSSLAQLDEVHPETTRRPEAPQRSGVDSPANNTRVFLNSLDRHFPR
jgi:hypothetical protein